jgi:DNA recombination-dependent growth factor C
MIKNATIYKLAKPVTIVHHDLEPMAFAPTGLTQELSVGWVPPHDGAQFLTEKNSGATIMRLKIEAIGGLPAQTKAA